MAHTPETRARAYEKIKTRRLTWLQENGPCQYCGSWSNLEVDHINPETKIDHKVWSWSEMRRVAELSKCQVLCSDCHREKSNIDLSTMNHAYISGINNYQSKLTDQKILEIRMLYQTGLYTQRELGSLYDMDHSQIGRLIRKESYK